MTPDPRDSETFWKLWNRFTGLHNVVYRASGGRIAGRMGKAPFLLLDHVGRRSGKRRTSPLIYLRDSDDLVVVASKGGVPKHPAWLLNLRDSPRTTVQVGGRKREVTAREATDAERERLWPRLVEIYEPYESYQRRTERKIPVVILESA